MRITGIHGETDKSLAQSILDEKSSREKRADGSSLPKEMWPVARCEVTVVFTDDAGSDASIHINDWNAVSGLKIDMITTFVIG